CKVFVVKLIATSRYVPQLFSQPAAYGVVIVVGQMCSETAVKPVYIGYAHGTPAITSSLKYCFFFVLIVFVFYFTYDLLENVFHSHQARCAAIFIDNYCHMVSTTTEVS